MSAYDDGVGAVASDKELGLFGPSQLIEAINETNALVLQIKGVVDGGTVPSDLKKVWDEYFASWEAYRKPRTLDFYNNDPRYSLPAYLQEDLAAMKQFRERLRSFADVLSKRGYRIIGFDNKKGFAFGTKVIIGAAGLLALYIVAKEVGKGLSGSVKAVVDGEPS